MSDNNKLKPFGFQQTIINRFRGRDCAALLMSAGTGKTLVALHLLAHKFDEQGVLLRTVIFAPGITLVNWRREIELCTHIPLETVGVVMGSKAKRLKTINNPKYKILIINHEAVRSEETRKALIDFQPDCFICDESHIAKSHKTIVFKSLATISKNSLLRIIMTGTAVANSGEDLFSQFYLLNRGRTFGDKFYSFKNKWFKNLNAGWTSTNAYPKWVFIDSLKSEFKSRIAVDSVSMNKEDCLELPDVMEQTVNVEASKEQERHYKEVKTDLITWLDEQPDNPLVVSNALTKLLRLSEVLSGYMKLSDGTIEQFKELPKLDALMSIVDSTAQDKVIVYCCFRHDYEVIAKALKKKKIEYVEIHGGISAKQKIENVDVFNNFSNRCRVAIINPRSGGVGINLKSAKYSVYYSVTHSLIDFEQSLARNFRAGSIDVHKKITRYYLQHKGLIDEKILKALKEKKSFAQSILSIKELINS